MFDNSEEADPASDVLPEPHLLLHWRGEEVIHLADPVTIPEWAKPVVAAVLRRHLD